MAAAISATSSVSNLEADNRAQQGTPANATAFAGALRRAEGPTLVTPVRTKLDASQASQALAAAYRNVTGEEPTSETVRILTAQWAHETGHGRSMFNYNFGGIKGTGPGGLSVAQRTREGWGESEQTIIDRFRAYRTAEEGATDYVRLLVNRYPKAVEAARDGDPAEFVRALKARGYFTGHEGAYTRSIVALSGVPIPEGSGALLPTLEAPRVTAETSTHAVAQFSPLPPMSPLVDALALADEISRAALRIARATGPERNSG